MNEVKKFYKNILKYFFFLINKKLILKKKEEEYFTTSNIKFEKKKYTIFTLDKGKIYMDTSEGKYFYIYKNIILKKLSIDTGNLSKISNIIKYGITKFCKRFDFKVVSIISGRDAKDNYSHWLLDVLPKLIILENEFKKNLKTNLLVPSYDKLYQKESIRYLAHNKKINIISLKDNKFCKFRKIILCSNYSNGIYSHYFDKVLLNKLKDRILDQAKKKIFSINSKFNKIYISRKDASTKKKRYIENNFEIENYLIKKGFKIVILSNYTFLEQSLIFNKAKFIVGLHGAGFANLIFSKKKTKILEIGSPTWKNIDAYKKLSNCLSLKNYKRIMVKAKKNDNFTINLPLKIIQKYV
jgi:capsular polysaccharide biosynthesis protein